MNGGGAEISKDVCIPKDYSKVWVQVFNDAIFVTIISVKIPITSQNRDPYPDLHGKLKPRSDPESKVPEI